MTYPITLSTSTDNVTDWVASEIQLRLNTPISQISRGIVLRLRELVAKRLGTSVSKSWLPVA